MAFGFSQQEYNYRITESMLAKVHSVIWNYLKSSCEESNKLISAHDHFIWLFIALTYLYYYLHYILSAGFFFPRPIFLFIKIFWIYTCLLRTWNPFQSLKFCKFYSNTQYFIIWITNKITELIRFERYLHCSFLPSVWKNWFHYLS